MENVDWLLCTVIIVLIHIEASDQAVYSCNPSASCGCSSNSAVVSRVVGGENAAGATWGWAVSLDIDGRSICGGSIISSSWIITAAHCVEGYAPSQVTIYAGSTTRWSGTQTRVASQLIIHRNYVSFSYVNDIALIKLAIPLTMTDPQLRRICLPSISPAILATSEWPPIGISVVAVGWGRLSAGGASPMNLQQVTVQTVAHNASTCSQSMYNNYVQFCAGVSGGGKDTCQGDSGGPLMMFTSNNQWVLVGLTSNGIGCADALYSGVYTRVAAFQDWISMYTNDTITVSNISVASPVPSPLHSTVSVSVTTITSRVSHANTVKMSFSYAVIIMTCSLSNVFSF